MFLFFLTDRCVASILKSVFRPAQKDTSSQAKQQDKEEKNNNKQRNRKIRGGCDRKRKRGSEIGPERHPRRQAPEQREGERVSEGRAFKAGRRHDVLH